MTRRFLSSLLLLVAIIILPPWLYLPGLFLAIMFFPLYWEGILLGFVIDVLYGRGITPLPSLISPFAVYSLALIIIMIPVRKRLRAYV